MDFIYLCWEQPANSCNLDTSRLCTLINSQNYDQNSFSLNAVHTYREGRVSVVVLFASCPQQAELISHYISWVWNKGWQTMAHGPNPAAVFVNKVYWNRATPFGLLINFMLHNKVEQLQLRSYCPKSLKYLQYEHLQKFADSWSRGNNNNNPDLSALVSYYQ